MNHEWNSTMFVKSVWEQVTNSSTHFSSSMLRMFGFSQEDMKSEMAQKKLFMFELSSIPNPLVTFTLLWGWQAFGWYHNSSNN